MKSELAGLVNGVPERFVPETMHGELVEAEHLARYWWASGLARDKRVLDAGCGLAYGASILAQNGAREVVGVDVAGAVLEAARANVPPSVQLAVGDVHALPLPDRSFDLVVCFEVLEHIEDAEAAIAEFARVLTPSGVVVASSPNRDVYVPGNPHHRHEFVPGELRAVLAESFANVRLFRQHAWVTSAVLDDEDFSSARELEELHVRKAVSQQPGEEVYTLALASDDPLPDPPPYAVLTLPVELRRWLALYDDQREALDRQAHELRRVETLLAERVEALERLREAEQLLAQVPMLEQAAQEAERASASLVQLHQTRLWRAGERYWRLRARLRRQSLD